MHFDILTSDIAKDFDAHVGWSLVKTEPRLSVVQC